MSTLWFLPPLSDTREGVPTAAAVVPVAVTTVAALWSAVTANRDGLAPRPPSVLLSGIATAVYTLTSSASARNPHSPDGASWFPWMLALQGYELVTEHCGPDLPGPHLRMARCGAVVLVVLGWFRSPRPRSFRALVSEVIWPLGIGIWAGATARAIKADATRLGEEIGKADTVAVASAFAAGRQRVLEYFNRELQLAEGDFEVQGRTMDARHRTEAQRRLAEVRNDLFELSEPPINATTAIG